MATSDPSSLLIPAFVAKLQGDVHKRRSYEAASTHRHPHIAIHTLPSTHCHPHIAIHTLSSTHCHPHIVIHTLPIHHTTTLLHSPHASSDCTTHTSKTPL